MILFVGKDTTLFRSSSIRYRGWFLSIIPGPAPLLEALDYAQRTNTIGSITAADVSRTITAPAVIAAQQSAPQTIVNNTYTQEAPASDGRMVAVLDRLDARLNEPFVTVNTVSGDHGIQKAQEEYDRLIEEQITQISKIICNFAA